MATTNIPLLTIVLVLLFQLTIHRSEAITGFSTEIIRYPGTFDVLVVLNLHDKTDGLRCTGSYNSRVAYDVEVLRSAVKYVDQTNFNGTNTTIGLTVIDSCGSTAVALRDITAALSGTANLPDTGPTVGILVPGSGSLTATIVELISIPHGITTIGYLPSDDIYFDVPEDEGSENQNVIFTTAVPLRYEALAIANILDDVDWYNVGLLYSGYGTGPSRSRAFLEVAHEYGICVSFQYSFPAGATQQFTDELVNKIVDSDETIQVLVYLVSAEEVQLLARSFKLVPSRFFGIGTSSWKDAREQELLDDSLFSEVEGTIIIDDRIYKSASQYPKPGDNDTTEVNPWLQTIFMNELQEGVNDSTDNVLIMSSYVASLNDSIHIIAEGINIACDSDAECTGSTTSPIAIRNAINTIDGEPRFNNQSHLYDISTVSENSFVEVGVVELGLMNSMSIELDVMVPLRGIYSSDGCYCKGPVPVNSVTQPQWIYTLHEDQWTLALLVVSLIGGFIAFLLLLCQAGHCKYPVVKKSAVVSNLFILIGIMLMYCISYFYIRAPTNVICGLRQFGTAFIYSFVFAALVVKALALRMTLRSGQANISKPDSVRTVIKKSKMCWTAQSFLFFAFLAPQIALSVQWIVFTPPAVISDAQTCAMSVCNTSNLNIILSMIYVYVLVLVTFIVSLLLVVDKRVMHESRSLLVTSFCTMMFLAAWAVAFTLADPVYQIPALCIGVTANATIILFALFMPFCCVLMYGDGSKKPLEEEDEDDEKEDDGNAIAYVNPAFINVQSESSFL